MSSATIRTIADLLERVGVPPDRIRFHPYPGTATIQDVIQLQEHEGVLCELVEGVLLEKTVGLRESILAGFIWGLLDAFVRPRNLGMVATADGTMELMPDLVRIPDVSFISWDHFPGRRLPDDPIPRLAPNLAVEVLSRSNTAKEMAAKRRDYFAAGVQLVWEVDPETRTVLVYTTADRAITLQQGDVLDGGTVLPGFAVPLKELFAELDRQG